MYLRIGISPSSRPFHRFLWRDVGQSTPPDVYQFNSLLFGVNSCPYQAEFVSQKHARENKEQYPRAAETILESTCMDDSMDSSPSEKECIKLHEELLALWGSAGMHARKWLSNSEQVLKKIPEEERAAEVDLDKGNLLSMRTLGVLWSAKEDVFTYRVNPPDEKFQLTMRNFLRKIAMQFDPMGFLAPNVIRAKILLQEMWASGLDWDDPLDLSQARQAKKWFEELTELSDVRVPRCLQLTSHVETVTLHTFTDASTDAYGSVTYVRNQYKGGAVSTSPVASKTRVAPLSATSILRLELMGAVLGLRLALSIAKVLKIDQSLLTFWSDRMNVLWWIRRPSSSFRPFIAYRIGEIHDSSSPTRWLHVSTHQNPADLPTRGMSVTEVKGSEMWWKGPRFRGLPKDTWPNTEIDVTPEATLKVRKKARATLDVLSTESVLFVLTPKTTWRLHPSRYSNWTRLLRVRAWVHRFLNNCGMPPEERGSGELSSQEISDAETDIIKEAQQEAFQEEYKALANFKSVPQNSKLLSLNPILDEDGLLRSDGRLHYADYLPFDARYPVILPRKGGVTRLIGKSYHERSNHAVGNNHTLSLLSARFWIMQGREEIRDWKRQCCECRKRKAKAAKKIMAPPTEDSTKTALTSIRPNSS